MEICPGTQDIQYLFCCKILCDKYLTNVFVSLPTNPQNLHTEKDCFDLPFSSKTSGCHFYRKYIVTKNGAIHISEILILSNLNKKITSD